MSLSFPESYDELAVLAHYGATGEELARRLAEREQMGQQERFHVDLLARSHQGPTLDDHRARWAMLDDPAAYYAAPAPPERRANPGQPLPPLPDAAYPPGATPLDPVPGVPGGTIPDVLDWVGADPSRAQAALDAEEQRDRPRTSLLDTLQKIVDVDG